MNERTFFVLFYDITSVKMNSRTEFLLFFIIIARGTIVLLYFEISHSKFKCYFTFFRENF